MLRTILLWIFIWLVSPFLYDQGDFGEVVLFVLCTMGTFGLIADISEKYSKYLVYAVLFIYLFYINQWLGYDWNPYVGLLLVIGFLFYISKIIVLITLNEHGHIVTIKQKVMHVILICLASLVLVYNLNENTLNKIAPLLHLSFINEQLVVAKPLKFQRLIERISAGVRNVPIEIFNTLYNSDENETSNSEQNIASSTVNHESSLKQNPLPDIANVLTQRSCPKEDLDSLGSYSIPKGIERPSYILNANLNKNQEKLAQEIYQKIQLEKSNKDMNLSAARYAFSQGEFRIATYFMDKSIAEDPASTVFSPFYYFYVLSAFQLYEDGQGLYSLEYTNFWLARSKLFAKYYLEIEGGCGRYSTGAKKIVGQGSVE